MREVLWTAAAILGIVWLLGVVTAFTLYGWIHLLGASALVLLLMGWMAKEGK